MIKEDIVYMVDSTGVSHPEVVEEGGWSISQFFLEGGVVGMILITLFLIGLFVAAWKAPRWVKEIGIGALVVSIFWTLCGLYQMFGVINMYGGVSLPVFCGGLKVSMISFFYGLIVYFISLVIRVIQKPRL